PAVSPICNRLRVEQSGDASGFGRSAEYNSAIRHVANLRYGKNCRPHARKRLRQIAVMLALALGILLVCSISLLAGPTPVTFNGNTATAQGNQSAGVNSGVDFDPSIINILNVNSLFVPINPAN